MWEAFKDYMSRPFKGAAESSALDWFLFIGLLLVLLAGWRIIFTHIEDAI